MGSLERAIKQFKGEIFAFTSAQTAYIERMFTEKGPVLIRRGKNKNTRFYSPEENKKFAKGDVLEKKNNRP